MEATENSIAPGTVIDGKYKIGRVIGSGGMGTVYEALQLELNRKVAIKLLHPRYAKSQKIIHRFHQEAKLAGSIDHDNICRVTDHGTEKNGAPYLVMPLLSGKSLAEMLQGKSPLSLMRVIDIVCQTLSALDAAHREKIVHRDLKPDNIFVTHMGDREDFVKLLDFGISKVLETESASSLTSTGMVLGTAYYLAPEQARGAKHIDHRVDIFAMGVILYEALTGIRPFEGETYNEVVFKIAGDPVKMPRSLNPGIPKSVEQVILKAMAIDPNERFSSAIEMCEALERSVVNGENSGPDPVADTLADTMSNTKADAAVIPAASALGKSRLSYLVILLIVGAGIVGGAVLYAVTQNGDSIPQPPVPAKPQKDIEPPADNTAAKDAPSDRKPAAAEKKPVEDNTASLSSTEDPRDTDAASPSAVGKSADTALTKASPPTLSHAKSAKIKPQGKSDKDKEDVIKGKFNTTFVFEKE